MHKPFLDPIGLTFPQYLVMLELLGGGPRSVGELGTKLGMDTGTITPILKRLERSKLIAKRRDALDERRVVVDLAPDGKALREGIWAVPDKIMTACRLAEEKTNELRDALDRVGRLNGDRP
ncbi:MarR family transcriptional regulator [Sphingopyxis bauzanensis]|uniref:MarR family transcriptional regulator n=2 Tax=Sphingopyxis bauzanensis TaxID=651663 RepID=A0A246JSW8_9SPHN|nr:MarR family transcriptional regulator [Sphingopyxis bauzanensis]